MIVYCYNKNFLSFQATGAGRGGASGTGRGGASGTGRGGASGTGRGGASGRGRGQVPSLMGDYSSSFVSGGYSNGSSTYGFSQGNSLTFACAVTGLTFYAIGHYA